MDNQDTIITHYAILIGIDAYPNRPLTSCVQDVQEINNCLEEVLNSVHIQLLTAPKSTQLNPYNLVEGSVLWPTHNNVISAFRKTTSLAKSGDFVYIHYSGHGTRYESCAEFRNEFTGDLALVLLDGEKGNDERYLRGMFLARLLKNMIDKGLVVTLVLDCCFSATVYREGNTMRFLPYDAKIDSKYPLNPEKSLEKSLEKSPGDEANSAANRDASMLLNWLINPDGYAILVACGPHEVAKGITYELDGQNHGALSYFLLKTFKEYGGLRKKHKYIYHHLCAMFREFKAQQNPVLYGNMDQGFFGHIDSEIGINPISIVERDRSLQLQAGQAHGVCNDDSFTMCPLGSVESDSSSKEKLVIAKVTQAGALTSNLEILETTSVCARTGWIAEPLTRAIHQKFPIRLASSLPHQNEWLAPLRERSLDVHDDRNEYLFSFHILLNNDMEYEILDKFDNKIINLPAMPHDQINVSIICDILEHLVKYELVKSLTNKISADAFVKSFEVQIISRSGEIFHPECVMEVEQNEEVKSTFELQVKNKGNKNLYVYVYNLGPCWQVQNIYRGSYEVIPPRNNANSFKGTFLKKLKTIIPPEMKEKGHRQCQDIIKVFVTSKPTSFDLLELPKLGKLSKRNTTVRGGQIDSDTSEEWAALTFPIRTFLK